MDDGVAVGGFEISKDPRLELGLRSDTDVPEHGAGHLGTLPHSDPGKVEAWSRTNGNLTLTIRPGWDYKRRRSYGYPYGIIPRLLLFWITTEAVRTGNRRLYLGNSLAAFMRELGLNPATGGGPRSDAQRLRDQMIARSGLS